MSASPPTSSPIPPVTVAVNSDLEYIQSGIRSALERLQHWLSHLQTLYARDNGMNQVGFKGMLLSQFSDIEAQGWEINSDQELMNPQAAAPEYLDIVLRKGNLTCVIKLKYWRIWYCRFQNSKYSLSEQYQQYNRRYRTASSKRKWWRRHLDHLKEASDQEIRAMDRHDMGRYNSMTRELSIAQNRVQNSLYTLSQQESENYMLGLVVVGVGNRAVHEWINLEETKSLIIRGLTPSKELPAVQLPAHLEPQQLWVVQPQPAHKRSSPPQLQKQQQTHSHPHHAAHNPAAAAAAAGVYILSQQQPHAAYHPAPHQVHPQHYHQQQVLQHYAPQQQQPPMDHAQYQQQIPIQHIPPQPIQPQHQQQPQNPSQNGNPTVSQQSPQQQDGSKAESSQNSAVPQ